LPLESVDGELELTLGEMHLAYMFLNYQEMMQTYKESTHINQVPKDAVQFIKQN
jgi:hypothetical protein